MFFIWCKHITRTILRNKYDKLNCPIHTYRFYQILWSTPLVELHQGCFEQVVKTCLKKLQGAVWIVYYWKELSILPWIQGGTCPCPQLWGERRGTQGWFERNTLTKVVKMSFVYWIIICGFSLMSFNLNRTVFACSFVALNWMSLVPSKTDDDLFDSVMSGYTFTMLSTTPSAGLSTRFSQFTSSVRKNSPVSSCKHHHSNQLFLWSTLFRGYWDIWAPLLCVRLFTNLKKVTTCLFYS